MRPFKFHIVAIVLLLWGALIYWPTNGSSQPEKNVKPTPNARLQRIVDEANATGIAWDPAAVAVAMREDAGKLPGVDGCFPGTNT